MKKPTTWATTIAAQVWCQKGLEKKEMDVDLAMEFARLLDMVRLRKPLGGCYSKSYLHQVQNS